MVCAIVSTSSWLEINIPCLESNLQTVRSIIGSTVRVCAVVKADAYGLGGSMIASRLASRGVDMLAVYSPDQAETLISARVTKPILMLGPVRELARTSPLYRLAVTDRLHLSIHDLNQLDQLNGVGQTFGLKLPVHLYLDTGMSRSGLIEAQWSAALSQTRHLKHLQLAGLFTHLSTADSDPDFAKTQEKKLDRFLAEHADMIPPGTLIHSANTFATLRHRCHHRSMVRVGLSLLGYGDTLLTEGPVIANVPRLKPTVRWLSKINHIQNYPKGTPVGYGCTHLLKRDSTLAVVPVGYADGYPLTLGNKAVLRVLSTDHQIAMTAPVLGRVSMDQIVIDLTRPSISDGPPHTEIPPPLMGDTVELISHDPQSPNALPHLAEQAEATCYSLLCGLSKQVPRRYVTQTMAPIVKMAGAPLSQEKRHDRVPTCHG